MEVLEGNTAEFPPLDEDDLKMCQRIAGLLDLAGFDAKDIKKLMDEVKNKGQIDYLLEYLWQMAQESKEFIEYNAKLYEAFPQVSAGIRAMQTASGLTDEQAKTCVYYAAATYGLKQLDIFPILVFQGAQGTGKSDAIKTLEQLVYKPAKIVGTKLSEATLRDELGKTREATAFFEEGDKLDEAMISNRYSRATAEQKFKKELQTGWKQVKARYFGATVLHKRKPFNDPATASRCIIIKTRHRGQRNWYVPGVEGGIREGLQELWDKSTKQPAELEYSGRAADVWKPLITVAMACGDIYWLVYCLDEIQKATESLKRGQQFEPDAMTVSALIALSHSSQEVAPLVALSGIRENLKKEYNWQPSSWAVGDMVRNFGFEVKTSHGQQKVMVDKEKLAQVAKELGIGE